MTDDAVDMLTNLEEQLDLTQIACKLISMALAKRKVRGPDQIGVSGPKLKSVLAGGNAGTPQCRTPRVWRRREAFWERWKGWERWKWGTAVSPRPS